MRVTTATAGGGDNLSRREREVVQLLAEGLAVGEVARTLEISVNTARGHNKANGSRRPRPVGGRRRGRPPSWKVPPLVQATSDGTP